MKGMILNYYCICEGDDAKLLFCLSCLSVCLSVRMSVIASKREVSTQIGS